MASLNKVWLTASACVAFLFFAFFASVPLGQTVKLVLFRSPPIFDTNQIQASRQNIWADLSENETDEVLNFLYSKSGLNLTETSQATHRSNRLMLIEALKPNKTDALAYINGTSGPPERWARVIVVEGEGAPGDVEQAVYYMVGPLPPSENTKALPLEFCYNSDRNYIASPVPSPTLLNEWVLSSLGNNSDVVRRLLSDEAGSIDPLTLNATGRASFTENGTFSLWLQFRQPGGKSSASSLLPQGLYVKIEIPTVNPSTWRMLQWYYNNILYDSIYDLKGAMKSPGFEICPLNRDGDWTDTVDLTKGDPGRQKPPPLMVQPQGSRFSVDKQQNFFSWMGFEFFISTSADTGVTLHDIRFNGDSVIYELGLQEALSHYAGDDPAQGGLEFLDTVFLMGLRTFELVPGYDCPAYATFISTTFNQQGSSITIPNSICIFEYTADYPLQRHTADSQVSVSRNTYLVVRSVSTVGNYDYTIEYIFYLDGSIEVKYRASGYIFGAFWPSKGEKKNEYGYRVHDAVATSMHDHVLNFKADLDVDGTSNTLTRVAIEPVSLEYPWDDKQTTPRNTMHLVQHPVDMEAGIDWPRNSGEMYIVTSENSTNIWGEKRGYRIQPGTGMGTPMHLSILNSTSLGKSAEWSSRDLWVVKQKDTEPRSASHLNYFDPLHPLVDFSKFLDDEEILQEDLVIYFNIGSHHVPNSGDIPNTLMHTASSSVMFTPFNFHDRDPSRRSAQGVKLDLEADGTKPEYFGGRNEKSVQLKATDMEPDLSKYGHEAIGWANVSWFDVLVGR